MKQSRIIIAFKALMRLSVLPLPLATAYKLHQLKTALEPHWKFQLEQEEKSIKECGALENPDGTVWFADDPPQDAETTENSEWGESRRKFIQKMNELANLDVEASFTPVTVNMDTPGLSISMNDLAALDGFIVIE